jgi:hypothetical protein
VRSLVGILVADLVTLGQEADQKQGHAECRQSTLSPVEGELEPGLKDSRAALKIAQTIHRVNDLARFALDKGSRNQRHGSHPYLLIGRSVRKPYSA